MSAPAQTDLWLELPDQLRRPALSGIRWTLWLTLIAVPFSFGTRLLLAHMGPHVLAVYGLLLVYINFVSTFFLLGGNAVIIRYLPAVAPSLRRGFLYAYGLVVAAWLGLWVLPALFAPGWLHLMFGALATARLCRLAILLAPLGILFSLALAALNGLLEMDRVQLFYRMVTIGSFCGYGLLVWLARAEFRHHPTVWIGGIYLLLVTLVAGLALLRLRSRLPPARRRWYLPPGFWKYTFSLEGVSILSFFAAELDTFFVLHRGGLHILGQYVAVMTLALALAPLVKRLLETFLASLTNALATNDSRAGALFILTYARLLLPGILCFGVSLAACAPLWLHFFGKPYRQLPVALAIAAFGGAVYSLNCFLGSMLTAWGIPERIVWAQLASIVTYILLFIPLWRAASLNGAVLAWTAAELMYFVWAAVTLLRRVSITMPGMARNCLLFFCILTSAIAVSIQFSAGDWPLRLLICLAAPALFVAWAGYSRHELLQLFRILLPNRLPAES